MFRPSRRKGSHCPLPALFDFICMPKTRKRLFFINTLKRAVDNTIAGAVLIDQYYRMYLVGADFWTYSAFLARGHT